MHAFLRLTHEPDKVIHLQGYPGRSNSKIAWVWARLMDYEKMMEARNSGEVSVGNEGAATIMNFPNFGTGIGFPYDHPTFLEDRLNENLPQFRRNFAEDFRRGIER